MAHEKIYDPRPRQVVIAAGAGIAFLGVTAAVAICAWRSVDPTGLYVVGGIWAVAPPAWFWYEYFYLFREKGNPNTFEAFKYGQQVSLAIWAGVTLGVFALASSEHFKTAKTPPAASTPTATAPAPSPPAGSANVVSLPAVPPANPPAKNDADAHPAHH